MEITDINGENSSSKVSFLPNISESYTSTASRVINCADMSTGGCFGGAFASYMADGMLAGLSVSGYVNSTIKSAVSEGIILSAIS